MSRLTELRARIDAHRAELARKRGASDPVEFARSVGIEPDPWQAEVLRSKSKRVLLNCCRQAGKSTVAAVVASHGALYEPGELQLLISPSLRQSGELFRKVTETIGRVPGAPSRTEDNKLSLTLSNGSRIVSLPSSEGTIRGFSRVRRVIEDEAAFVHDALYTAVRPMLAVSDGGMWLMSTPNGRRGHFFEAWERGGEAWMRQRIQASRVPRISAEFLADERRAIGEARYRQEYECEFVHAASGAVYRFDHDKNEVDAAPKCTSIVVGIDYGYNDECAFSVLGWCDHDRTVYVLECWKRGDMIPSEAAVETRKLIERFNPDRVVGDTGGLGKGYVEEARRRFALPITAAAKENKRGYIDLMNDALREGRLKTVRGKCDELIEEWRTLSWDERRLKEAAGYANHCADATLYGWRACAAFCEEPAVVRPKAGSPAALLAEEEKILEDRIAEMEQKKSREWWE